MQLSAIATNRYSNNWPSWHVVHEWEDDLALALQLPIKEYKEQHRVRRKLKDVFSYHIGRHLPITTGSANRSSTISSGYYLIFEMTQKLTYAPSVTTQRNAIPVIIDFFCTVDRLVHFYNTYKHCRAVLISSLEAYEFLKKNNCPLNIYHFPLSLSDRYKNNGNSCGEKPFDIVIAGRTNSVLKEFFDLFIKKFPEVEYVYRTAEREQFYYLSNKKGRLGDFEDRQGFMGLLKQCKIAFYTTPGIDEGKERTAGFNPVTPRYLELLSAGCHVLGRYPNNEESNFYELPKLCPNIESYEQFEVTVLQYLHQGCPNKQAYENVLNKHYTSQRALLLQQILGSM